MPNLIVTKVALGADPWLINTDTALNVTVKNDGSAAAGASYVSALAVTADGNATNDLGQQDVASLAPGASTQVAFNANVANATDYTITVTADVYDNVAESNENDNTKSLTASAVDLPNLYINGTLAVTPKAAGSDSYEVAFSIGNNGSAAAVDPTFDIFAYDSAENKYDLGFNDLSDGLAARGVRRRNRPVDVVFTRETFPWHSPLRCSSLSLALNSSVGALRPSRVGRWLARHLSRQPDHSGAVPRTRYAEISLG